jgi:hypothetical protein
MSCYEERFDLRRGLRLCVMKSGVVPQARRLLPV